MNKILVTGATGLIGSAIVEQLLAENRQVIITSRNLTAGGNRFGNKVQYLQWDGKSIINDQALLRSISNVFHLSGASVAGKRWTPRYKKEILSSRTESSKSLVDSFKIGGKFPDAFICSSATGYYGSRGDEELTENSGKGEGFLADVCEAWESGARAFAEFGTRTVSIRTGIVLDKKSGALPQMLLPFRFRARVTLGNGKQWFSWIHIEDIARLYVFALNNNISGIINGTAPEPVTMDSFTRTIAKFKPTIAGLKIPAKILHMIVGEAGFEILKSQKVIPERALKESFRFSYPDVDSAIASLV